MKCRFGGIGDMQPVEVIITKQPKPNPQATTGAAKWLEQDCAALTDNSGK